MLRALQQKHSCGNLRITVNCSPDRYKSKTAKSACNRYSRKMILQFPGSALSHGDYQESICDRVMPSETFLVMGF